MLDGTGKSGREALAALQARLVRCRRCPRLVAHRDGYGFVVLDKPMPNVAGDLFINPENLSDAMHGDTVAVRLLRRRPDGRGEGVITRVVKRSHPTVVGVFRYDPRGNFVLPYETRIQQEIVIPPGEELPAGLRARMSQEELALYAKQRSPPNNSQHSATRQTPRSVRCTRASSRRPAASMRWRPMARARRARGNCGC